jgi:hypothetical protein
MSMDTLQELENNIKTAKGFVDTGKALERLRSNRDFKEVFIKGYLEKEAIRLVHLKADPSMQTPERQASIVRQIDAIGCVSEFMSNTEHFARLASKSIADDEATRDELLSEGGA